MITGSTLPMTTPSTETWTVTRPGSPSTPSAHEAKLTARVTTSSTSPEAGPNSA